jgi:hypothetical protein
MEDDYGKQMGKAIRAVLEMHADCIRLFHDMDKALDDYESLLGNVVALNQGTTMGRREFIAEALIRLYVRKRSEDRVLGVNICFYDQNDKKFVEPIVVVANIQYLPGPSDPQEKLKKGWDPWYAFLAWIDSDHRIYGEAIKIEKPSKRANIEQVMVAAAPLYTISSLKAAASRSRWPPIELNFRADENTHELARNDSNRGKGGCGSRLIIKVQ